MEQFEPFSTSTSVENLRRLRAPVVTHLQVLEEHLLADEQVDVVVGRRIAETLLRLIDDAVALDRHGRDMLRSAIEYFVLRADADDDVASPVGLHDDAGVLNDLCDRLGRPELRIELD